MRWWPFGKSEKRESSYTDEIVARILDRASISTPGDPSATWALETSAALYGRAFAAAKISGDRTEGITPSMLALIARNLIRRGESLHFVGLARGSLDFSPAGYWDIRGGANEKSWRYRIDLFGPSGQVSHFVGSGQVLHFRYAVDPASPWRGISPLGWARETGALSGNLERRLQEEAGGPVAHVLAIPQDGGDGGDDDPLASLKGDIAGAKGRTILMETTAAAWGDGSSAAPRKDWQPSRLGADPPDVLRGLRSDAGLAVLSACGVPVSLATDADGTSQRESWRRFVMGGVEPLLEIVREELERKLETEIAFDLSGLWAHDLQGRAVAFQKLVAGGVGVNEALATSGLMGDE